MRASGNRKDRSERDGKPRGERNLRNACSFELLEGRILMSGGPVAAPSALTVVATGTSFVELQWKDNTSAALEYEILRSLDGVHYSTLAVIASGTVTSCTDYSALSGHVYDYKVEAVGLTTISAASNVATAVTPLVAPTGLTAQISGPSVELFWHNNDAYATGYLIYRSQSNVNFNLIATVAGGSVDAYTQQFPAYGKTFYYRVEAFDAAITSAPSASAVVTTPVADVSVTTRYGDELVVNAMGLDDFISVAESGTTLTITADRQTFTDAATAAGLFVYTRGGTDAINIAASVTADTTLETIDGALTTITSAGSDVTAWCDSTDSYSGKLTVHAVSSFAGGVSKAEGASLANPTDGGTTITVNASLFGTGPVIGDVNQGSLGDCYFLSSLAAFAQQNPQIVVQSAVDMGDGTYTVQFMNNWQPTYVRVSNQFSAGPFEGLKYAHPGADGSIWAMVLEKAFAYFRTGANTYASVNSGWMGDVYNDFDVYYSYASLSGLWFNQNTFYSTMLNDLNSGQSVTLATSDDAPNLVSDHAYTLVAAYTDSGGVERYIVRNPWGVSGDSLENSQGYATLTFAQLAANFTEECASMS